MELEENGRASVQEMRGGLREDIAEVAERYAEHLEQRAQREEVVDATAG